jgi:hypothetical protein
VIFQGRQVALNQLKSAESMTDCFSLADLLQEKEITIGVEPIPSVGRGYSEKFSIDSILDKLLQQTKNQKVMIIADKAGMGKSNVPTHLTKRIKHKYPANWLVRIDLNDCTELFKDQKEKKLDKERVLEFVSNEVLNVESDLENELLMKRFEGNEIKTVMVDEFELQNDSH